MRKGRKIMIWVLCIVAVLVAGVIIFFQIPYSGLLREFQNEVQHHKEQSNIQSGIFTEESIARLPAPVQNHFRAAGLINQPIMENMRAFMPSATLRDSSEGSPMIIDYTLYCFAYKPSWVGTNERNWKIVRLALHQIWPQEKACFART